MAWVEHTFVIPWDVVWYWGCVPAVEQSASRSVALASGLVFPFVIAETIDLSFEFAYPLWWEVRLSAWRESWLIEESEVDIDGTSVRLYSSVAAWVDLLRADILSGGGVVGDSVCPTRPPYSEAGGV